LFQHSYHIPWFYITSECMWEHRSRISPAYSSQRRSCAYRELWKEMEQTQGKSWQCFVCTLILLHRYSRSSSAEASRLAEGYWWQSAGSQDLENLGSESSMHQRERCLWFHSFRNSSKGSGLDFPQQSQSEDCISWSSSYSKEYCLGETS
jgi:hypothetical protein